MVGEPEIPADWMQPHWLGPAAVIGTRPSTDGPACGRNWETSFTLSTGRFSPGDNRERKSDAWKNAKSRLAADSDVELPGGDPGAEGLAGYGRPGTREAEFRAEPGEGD